MCPRLIHTCSTLPSTSLPFHLVWAWISTTILLQLPDRQKRISLPRDPKNPPSHPRTIQEARRSLIVTERTRSRPRLFLTFLPANCDPSLQGNHPPVPPSCPSSPWIYRMTETLRSGQEVCWSWLGARPRLPDNGWVSSNFFLQKAIFARWCDPCSIPHSPLSSTLSFDLPSCIIDHLFLYFTYLVPSSWTRRSIHPFCILSGYYFCCRRRTLSTFACLWNPES